MLFLLKLQAHFDQEAIEDVGFFVRACVSDMGPANQDMWKFVGIRSSRDSLTNFIAHPVRENCKLYFMADPPHLLKNIRNCLLSQNIILPDETVCKNCLPSNIVSLQHVTISRPAIMFSKTLFLATLG
jgi:hypothetical protein